MSFEGLSNSAQGPDVEPPIPQLGPEPTPESIARSQWELQQATTAPIVSREAAVLQWIQNIRKYEPGTAEREEREQDLRHQLMRVYDQGEDMVHIPPEDIAMLVHRLGLLGVLAERIDDSQQNPSKTAAYDFASLVYKDAREANEVFDRDKEMRNLEERTMRDPLTGLKNRRGLKLAFNEMVANKNKYDGFAVFFIDLDNFKALNDELGHKKGDDALKLVATTLIENTRQPVHGGTGDVVVRPNKQGEQEDSNKPIAETVRMGGDEFLLLVALSGSSAQQLEENAKSVSDRLTAMINEALSVFAGSVEGLGASIGYAVWKEGVTFEDFIAQADDLMYATKQAKKDAAPAGSADDYGH